MENKRAVHLDYAKGVAIFLIVIYHLYGYTGRDNESVIYSICHVTQLPIFFYVSGLLYTRTINEGLRINIIYKGIRLLLPFCSFYVIWCIIDIQNILAFPADEFKLGYWFILALFEMMLLYSSIYRMFRFTSSPWPHLLFYLILTLYEVVIPKGNLFNMIFCINLLWHYYPFFFLGIYSDKMIHLMKKKLCAVVYLSIFGIAFYFYFAQGKQILASVCNLSSLLLLMTIFQHHVCIGKQTVARVGRYSMQVYLLHFMVLKGICPYIQVIQNRWMEFGYYVFIALIIITLTILVAIILEKYKWVALFLFGIKKKPRITR